MAANISIQLGVPKDQIKWATQLYCKAFAAKLSPFLGPEDLAARFLASSLVANRAFVALEGGIVVGIAGFKVAGKGLFQPSLRQFLVAYGWLAPVRALGLALLERRERPDCLLMDGIAVCETARGKGIGTRLLKAIENHARSIRVNSIRLDVIDTNPGARRLYERVGFVPVRTSGIGPLRLLFDFRRSTEMRKPLTSAD